MTAVLYNCLLLKSRTLTDHEKTNLDHVGVSYIPHEEYVLIGPKGGDFTSPMTIELTHYHHLDNLAPSTQAPSNTVTVDNQTSEGHVEAQTVRDGAVENTMLHVAETVSEVTATEQAAAHSESQATQDTETSAVKTETVPMTETITTTTATTTKPKSTPNSNAHIWIYVGTAMIVFVLVAVMITIMCDQENDPKEDDDTDDTEMDDDRRIRLFGRATYSDIVCNNPNPIPIELMAIRERGISPGFVLFSVSLLQTMTRTLPDQQYLSQIKEFLHGSFDGFQLDSSYQQLSTNLVFHTWVAYWGVGIPDGTRPFNGKLLDYVSKIK
ncbi:hypothetical protein D5F01_LYC23980 [Larimichthys crocea]|uniref:Uncharacterized protein n=1 Tax=Larimichthys crocea TaxID=215358 RepID=A0A6G0HFK8_LARCR|nr:hypothetical protein D5F01_LYC23980 [Larimichthys crocea]